MRMKIEMTMTMTMTMTMMGKKTCGFEICSTLMKQGLWSLKQCFAGHRLVPDLEGPQR